MGGMIRVTRNFPANPLTVKASSRRGAVPVNLASLSKTADAPQSRRDDSPPKKKRKKAN